jgi:hypothetical protein
MADLYMVCKMAMKQRIETYQCAIGEDCSCPNCGQMKAIEMTMRFFSLLIGVLAFYLSYSCPTSQKLPNHIRILNALVAFMFGGLYVLYYLGFRAQECYP